MFSICPNCGKAHGPLGRDPEYIRHSLSDILENKLSPQGEADEEAAETRALAGDADDMLPVQHGKEA